MYVHPQMSADVERTVVDRPPSTLEEISSSRRAKERNDVLAGVAQPLKQGYVSDYQSCIMRCFRLPSAGIEGTR